MESIDREEIHNSSLLYSDYDSLFVDNNEKDSNLSSIYLLSDHKSMNVVDKEESSKSFEPSINPITHDDSKSVLVKSNVPVKPPKMMGKFDLKKQCEKLGCSIWNEEQRLPFHSMYELNVGLSSERECLIDIDQQYDQARQERDHQNMLILNIAFDELLSNDRAFQLIFLLTPPEFNKEEDEILTHLKSKWEDFKTKLSNL